MHFHPTIHCLNGNSSKQKFRSHTSKMTLAMIWSCEFSQNP